MGLVGSHCMPPVLSHWPDQLGYLVSSCARAAAIVVTITVASTTAPIEPRTGMLSSHSAMGGKQKINLLRDQDRLSILQLGLSHGPRATRCTAAQRLDRELQLVAWLERLARPAVTDQRARSGAFEAPELSAAVLLLDRQDDERVRTGELELLHHAFELDRILLVEHRERVMCQNGTACGDKGKAHQCSQLPSHGMPPF